MCIARMQNGHGEIEGRGQLHRIKLGLLNRQIVAHAVAMRTTLTRRRRGLVVVIIAADIIMVMTAVLCHLGGLRLVTTR